MMPVRVLTYRMLNIFIKHALLIYVYLSHHLFYMYTLQIITIFNTTFALFFGRSEKCIFFSQHIQIVDQFFILHDIKMSVNLKIVWRGKEYEMWHWEGGEGVVTHLCVLYLSNIIVYLSYIFV